MKVKDLIKNLEKIDPEMPVYCTSNTGEYTYGVVNTATPKHIYLDGDRNMADSHEETLVFVIDEE